MLPWPMAETAPKLFTRACWPVVARPGMRTERGGHELYLRFTNTQQAFTSELTVLLALTYGPEYSLVDACL